MINEVFVQNTGTAFEDDGTTDLTGIPDLSVQLVNLGRDVDGGYAYGETIDTSAEVVAGRTIEDYDTVQLVFRDGDTEAEVFKSAPLDVATLEVSDVAYAAPAEQVTEVEIPSGPTGGDFWTIKITNLESGAQPFDYRSYEVEVEDGEAAADIVQKFVDAINNREDSINDFEGSSVTAAVNSGDSTILDLTANDVGDIFDVATQEFDAVSIDTTTNPTIGQGTYEQVLDYEERTRGTLGRYVQPNNILGALEQPTLYADTSGEYDLLNISAENDYDKGMNKSIQRLVYMVALESAVVGNATVTNTDEDYIEFLAPKIVASA